jgi:hypothetical protein
MLKLIKGKHYITAAPFSSFIIKILHHFLLYFYQAYVFIFHQNEVILLDVTLSFCIVREACTNITHDETKNSEVQ